MHFSHLLVILHNKLMCLLNKLISIKNFSFVFFFLTYKKHSKFLIDVLQIFILIILSNVLLITISLFWVFSNKFIYFLQLSYSILFQLYFILEIFCNYMVIMGLIFMHNNSLIFSSNLHD